MLLLSVSSKTLEPLQLAAGGLRNSHVLDGGIIDGAVPSQLLAEGTFATSYVHYTAGPGAAGMRPWVALN